MTTKPKAEPKPYVSGFCNITLPRTAAYDPHQNCGGCDCMADGCPCKMVNLRKRIGPGAILCGDADVADLEIVAQFADALRIADPAERAAAMDAMASVQEKVNTMLGNVATVTYGYGTAAGVDGATATVTITGDRWVWEADAAAEIMLEDEGACPMCTEDWPVHMFLDDGRVACP